MLLKSLLITFLSLGSSVIGFCVQLLLAERFGLGVELDAYLFSLSAPVFIAGTASAMMSYSLVPRLVECEEDRNYQRKYMGSVLIGVTIIAFLSMGILSNTLSDLQVYSLPVDSPIRRYENLEKLMFLSYLIGASQIVQGCVIAMVNSVRRHVLASILTLCPYIGMLVSLIVIGDLIGVLAVPIGMLLGIVICNISGVSILGSRLLPLPLWNGLLWNELVKLIQSSPFTAVTMSCFSSYVIVDAYWGPQSGVGTLATMGYAQRLIIGFGSLIVAGPSAVLVPRMAEFVRKSNYFGFRQFLVRAILIVGGISTLISFLLAIFAEPLVKLLFARGEFGDNQVIVLASTLRYMLPGMVAMLISIIALRALFCFNGGDKISAFLGLSWTIFYFISSFFLYQKGAEGLAIGYSLVWVLFFIGVVTSIVFFFLNAKINNPSYSRF